VTAAHQISPGDAAVALRSLPRRYRAALRPIDDDQVEEWAQQVGADGSSAVEHLAGAARGITMLHQALRQVMHASSPPVLLPAVLDASAREWGHTDGDVEAELVLLADEAEAMAQTVTDAPGKDWTRTATVAGHDGEITALDVVAEAVRTGVDELKAATAAFESARHRS